MGSVGDRQALFVQACVHDASTPLFGPYRSHFLSRKSLIAAKNETKEKRWKEEGEALNSTCE